MERTLRGEQRDATGKGAARKIRAAGRIPGVVYGHGAEPMHVTLDERELSQTLHTEAGMNVLVDLRVDGDGLLAMPKEVQRDHLRGQLVHVDFLRIARDEKVTVEVPINLIGDSQGVREGGVIEHHLWALRIECLPRDVPEAVDADVSGVGLNGSLKVADLTVPDTLVVLTPEDETVISVVPPQVLEVAEALPEDLAGDVEAVPPDQDGADQPAEAGSQS